MNAQIFIDGSAQPNPGHGGAGAIIKDHRGKVVAEISRYLGSRVTNNQAEYWSLIDALTEAKRLGAEQVEICSDSQLLVRQLKGLYKAKNDLTTGMLQGYVAKRVQKVKPKTVNNEIVVLRRMLKHAVRWGYLRSSPAEYVERPKVEHQEMNILRPEEITRFLDKVTPEYRPLFLTAILTGMRRGELLGLQWHDINWTTKQIHVRRSLWKGSFITPKSKRSVRRIDMTPNLAVELKKHKLACPPSKLDLVFCTSTGQPLDPDNLVKREFLPALTRANAPRVRFHDLRHTNVALRIEQGQNIKYIQNQLGHASIQTTLDRYGHLIVETNHEQAAKLDSILGFGEHSGSSSRSNDEKSVRKVLEGGEKLEQKATKKRVSKSANPLILFGSGG